MKYNLLEKFARIQKKAQNQNVVELVKSMVLLFLYNVYVLKYKKIKTHINSIFFLIFF